MNALKVLSGPATLPSEHVCPRLPEPSAEDFLHPGVQSPLATQSSFLRCPTLKDPGKSPAWQCSPTFSTPQHAEKPVQRLWLSQVLLSPHLRLRALSQWHTCVPPLGTNVLGPTIHHQPQ